MTVITEAEIRANVDLSGFKSFYDMLDKVAEQGMSAKEAISRLEGQVKRYEEELAQCTKNTAQWVEADERLKRAKEELNKAVGEEGKKSFQAAQQEAKILAQEQKEAAKAADEHEKKLKKLARSAVGFLGQYFAIKKTFSAVMGFAKEGEELARMADLSGMSAQGIERLGIALKNYGGSASSASATLSKLNQQMQDLRFGKGGKLGQVAIRYGLNLNANTPEQMLLNIAKRMEGLGATQQVAMGRMLGLDNATLLLVQQGVEGVRKELEIASELSAFSEEDIKNAQKINREYREMQARLKQLSSITARSLMPLLETLFERVSNLAKALSKYPALLKTIGAVGFLAFAKWAGLLSPILIVVGLLVAGVALLIDDLATFMNGGDSFFDWGPVIDGAKQFKEDISDIIKKIKEFAKQSEFAKIIWEGIKFALGVVVDMVKKFANLIGGIFAAIVVKLQGGTWGEAWDALKASVSDDSNKTTAIQMGAEHIATADAFAGNTMTNNSIMSSSYTNSPVQYSYNVGKMELAFPGVTSKSVVDGAVYSMGQGIASNFGDTKK